jgi:hypothetical protein
MENVKSHLSIERFNSQKIVTAHKFIKNMEESSMHMDN